MRLVHPVILATLQIENFRSIRSATLRCDELTALVGTNGVGKSSFLRALELFYNQTPQIVDDDFYAGDVSNDIIVAVTYKDLPPSAALRFAGYMQDETLTVERVFVSGGGRTTARYHGATLRNPGFQLIRDGLVVKDRGKTARAAYDAVRENPAYADLPPWSTLGAAADGLSAWEAAHPHACARTRDDGRFFGFTSVAPGYLGRFTKLLYIPAVRDAADDAEEGRGSVFSALMDLVVRQAVADLPALIRLKVRSQALFKRALNPLKISQLANLSKELTATLGLLAPETSVDLKWGPVPEIDLPLPSADIRLLEEGFPSAVERTGHGLQRAFIFTILQHLAMAQAAREEAGDGNAEVSRPNLVLAIEEPELYQHPNRQRHLARTLARLASGAAKGVADRTQIVYGTHSPLFVSIDRIHQVRLLRRVGDQPDRPKVTRVIQTTLGTVAEALWKADGQPQPRYTATTVLPRLRSIMTPVMSEGFFANAVVLVEGEDDRAALLGVGEALGIDIESHGLTIIVCGGKTCLDRPFIVFTQLNIPTYLVWDGDKGLKDADPVDNHRLLRLVDEPVTDWPAAVSERYACFERDLEATMQADMGEVVYASLLAESQKHFSIPKRTHARKNPSVIAKMIEDAQRRGISCSTLEAVVQRIKDL